MKIKDIHINPKNPRYIKDDRFLLLVKNIKEFPKMMKLRPIIIDDTGMILGGNMRYLAMKELGYKDIPEGWVKKADDLTEEEREKFKILDNIPFGDWDNDILANEWDLGDLKSLGLELPDIDDYGTDFELPDGEKAPFQQMTFTLADEQAELIKQNMVIAKKDIVETFDNENSNGNALYRMVKEWGEQKI